MIVGNQLIALPDTVLTSLLNLFNTSPLLYWLIANQSASIILSKISACISLLIYILNLSVIRFKTLPKTKLNTVEPIMIHIKIGSFDIL